MKHSFLLITSILIIAATSCNNNSKTATEVTTSDDTAKPTTVTNKLPTTTCYAYIKVKDTVYLKLDKLSGAVTGSLSYKFYEKDSNKGEIDGKLNGDTLIADYKFMSEGILSTRQVIFLIKDSTATEGYAVMEEKNGKMVFKNINTVDFTKGIVLRKTTCKAD